MLTRKYWISEIWPVASRAYWRVFRQLSLYLPLLSGISKGAQVVLFLKPDWGRNSVIAHIKWVKGKRKINLVGFSDLTVIFTSAGRAIALAGSAGSVLSATEKKKEVQIQLSRPTGAVHSDKGMNILVFYANVSCLWSYRHACLFCWFTGKISVPRMYNRLHDNATCLDTRKNDLTWDSRLQLGNKVFQQQLQSLAGTGNSAHSDLAWNFLVASHKCYQSE